MNARVVAAGLATLLILAGLPDAAEAHHKDGPCHEIHWNFKPHPEHKAKIRNAAEKIIRCAARRWSVPGGPSHAVRVAKCESGLWPWAIGGDNLGLFQHKDDYWPTRARTYLRRWVPHRKLPEHYGRPGDRRLAFNAWANAVVSIRMAHRQGWSAWACA